MSSLPVRLISAAFAVGILFAVHSFFAANGLFIVTGILVFLGLNEYFNFFSDRVQDNKFFRSLFIVLGSLVYWASYFSLNHLLLSFWVCSFAVLTYLLLKIRNEDDRELFFQTQMLALVGLFYCGLSPALTAQTLLFPDGAEWFMTLLAIVFFGDSFAFFAGYFFGTTKLHPLVSPKKTWAGAAGGLLGSLVFGAVFAAWLLPDYSSKHIIWISLVTGLIGQIGDLFESLIKRMVGVKDSGSIMPGHGGILDRIDGVLIAGPVFFFLIKFIYF